MNYNKLGEQVREKIHEFSRKLSLLFSKPKKNFLEQMIFWIQSAKDVKLSEICRSLQETIPLAKTENRLSHHLADACIEENLFNEISKMGASKIQNETLLIIDPSDIRKPYARKMELFGKV